MIKSIDRCGKASVTFTLPASMGATHVVVCGEWNCWSTARDVMARVGDSFCLNIRLEAGRSYRFRYLLDGSRWENDSDADAYVPNPFGDEDSVVDLTALPTLVSDPRPTGIAVDGTREGATLECELELVAPGALTIPDQNGLVSGATAGVLPIERLGATHHGPADLRLARPGVTLQERAGESGLASTVRVREEGTEMTLARQVIRLEGSSAEVPEAAADPVLASSRDLALPPSTGRATAAGGAALWFGTLVFGGSTVALLSVLARHPHKATFASLAALLSVAFVVSLIPGGVQLRSASLVADGRPLPKMTPGQAVLIGAASLAVSPLLAFLLHIPLAATAIVSIQMVIAIPLAAKQGALLAQHRFRTLGINLVIEGATRFLIGAVAGLTLGVTGLAAGLCAGTFITLIVLPYRRSDVSVRDRPRTSIVDTSLSLALLGLYVQLDILIAPSVVARSSVTAYDLAAVPSKGIYLLLLAAGPIVFPFVRRLHGARQLIATTAAIALAVGVVFTVVLVAIRPFIATVLGRPEAGFLEFGLLGLAMSLAGVSGLVVNAGVARGVRRPWPPLVLGIATLLLCWPFRPDAMEFAIVVLVTHAVTAMLSVAICLWGRQREMSTDLLHQIEGVAEAGDPLASAQVMYALPNTPETMVSPSVREPRARRLALLRRVK